MGVFVDFLYRYDTTITESVQFVPSVAKSVNYLRNKTVSFSKLFACATDLKLATIIVYNISGHYCRSMCPDVR
jgi:hypothetical protein